MDCTLGMSPEFLEQLVKEYKELEKRIKELERENENLREELRLAQEVKHGKRRHENVNKQ